MAASKATGPDADPGDAELSVSAQKRSAAGVPALIASMRQVHGQLGAKKAVRTLLHLNQPDGFDCPGCAWPDPHHTSPFEFCENGVKAIAEEATDRRIDVSFFARHSIGELVTMSDYWLGQQGRLTEPMIRRAGDDHYRPISWDDAFTAIGTELRSLSSPNRAVFYTSGRTSNEAAFVYQLLARALGTNNLPDCSNMCHESSGIALGNAIGIGKGTVSLDDVHAAELILVIGQNPGTNHPRMLTALEEAKRRGASIVSINPLHEAGLIGFRNPQRPRGVVGRGTPLADLHLPIRVGADLALFQIINRRLVDDPSGAIDDAFVAASCDGVDELTEHLCSLDVDDLLAATGLDAAVVDELYARIRRADRIVACWAMGLTQHKQAVATIQELANTLLLRGAIGKPGAGLCPVRGHSNVQGDRTMGIYEKPTEEFLDALDREFALVSPRAHGFDTVDAIAAMATGDVDVFVGMGGNFVAAAPDTDVTAAAMERCRLTVQVSTKLNRSHARCGETAIILPCLGRTEIDAGRGIAAGTERRVTVEDSMSAVHATRGRNQPASPMLRSEVDIVCGIAAHAAPDAGIDWAGFADYRTIRAHIASVVPGFEDFERRIDVPGGFVLPNPPRDSRTFVTTTGTARLTVNRFEAIEVPAGRLLLQTIRSHDQYNTTIYGLDDRYRGIHQGRRVLLIAQADLDDHGLRDGDVVDLVGEWHDDVERRAPRFRLVTYDVPRGTCAAYFPETNVLVPLDSVADGSATPTSKSIVIRLERSRG